MSTIDPNITLGELVNDEPARMALLERLRLDYCCGGHHTLEEACAARGLDPQTVIAVLEALDETAAAGSAFEELDWRRATVGELCRHIVERHHERLRRELPRIEELLETVVRVHGGGHAGLRDLQRTFHGMSGELLTHLDVEESTLFPAAQTLEAGGPAVDASLIEQHEHEHGHVGGALAALRELTSDYRTDDALCGTHRALLDALRALERDLHQHIHEENNVLLPRVRELSAAAPAPAPHPGREG